MRTIPIAMAAVALLTSAAIAQTPAGTHPATRPGAATTPAPKPAVNPLTQSDVSKIEGTAVFGSKNDKIGHVSEVLMNPQTKKIDRLVVTAGGFLGVGGHPVALPIDQFSWDSRNGGFKLNTTEAALKSKPAWVEGATATGSSEAPGKAPAPAHAGDSASH
jgi:sporulation protein YlmC with PRC-barrel domain